MRRLKLHSQKVRRCFPKGKSLSCWQINKSELGWKTVEMYTQHADSEADDKKIRRAEERAEKAFIGQRVPVSSERPDLFVKGRAKNTLFGTKTF